MKAWQKVQMSPRLWYVMLFGTALFVIGAVAGAVFSWHGKTPCKHGQNVQSQPTPEVMDAPKPPTADAPKEDEETTTKPKEKQNAKPELEKKENARPPRNILGDIAAELRENMTAAELDAIIAKHTLGDDSLRFYVEKEHRPAEEGLPNGVDVENRAWRWRQDEGYFWRVDRTDVEWVTNLNVTLYNNTVVLFTYSWHREVDRGLMAK